MTPRRTMMEFDRFGWETDDPCDLCGKTPARIEARFVYKSCEKEF
jgi:hypothetical protein